MNNNSKSSKTPRRRRALERLEKTLGTSELEYNLQKGISEKPKRLSEKWFLDMEHSMKRMKSEIATLKQRV